MQVELSQDEIDIIDTALHYFMISTTKWLVSNEQECKDLADKLLSLRTTGKEDSGIGHCWH